MEKYGKSQRSMDMHKGLGLPGKVQKLLLFVDDIHLACLWETGSGSAEEMLHQAAAEGSVTDPDRSFQQGIQGVRFIASTVPSAVSVFSSRFLCQFVPVLLPNLSSESVSTIFRARTSHWLKSALSGQLQEDVVEQLANVNFYLTICFWHCSDDLKCSPWFAIPFLSFLGTRDSVRHCPSECGILHASSNRTTASRGLPERSDGYSQWDEVSLLTPRGVQGFSSHPKEDSCRRKGEDIEDLQTSQTIFPCCKQPSQAWTNEGRVD